MHILAFFLFFSHEGGMVHIIEGLRVNRVNFP